ncbi:hypothetical protein [Arthrobacter sp. 7Tela_A1]|uniref:hypothetical protein n=1 Tax=Arthrobacter sp. 7Tela_A1 TaxID=3093745 RepID=UPI003BB5F7E6
MRELMLVLDTWTVIQATALVSAVFGVVIAARACWDNTGLPALQDRYTELVAARADALRDRSPAPTGRNRTIVYARRLGLATADPFPGLGSSETGWLTRMERQRRSRPDSSQRLLAARSLARLLKRPGLLREQEELVTEAFAPVESAVRSAGSLAELAATRRTFSQAAGALLRASAARRFAAVFLPAMAKYLDFVGRGSAFGLALGVLLSGGMMTENPIVGVLTTVCGLGGAIVYTAMVIRCDARSWPARHGLPKALRRSYPEASFLLRLALTVTAVLTAVAILRL